MIVTGMVAGALVVLYLALAAFCVAHLRLTPRQAFLYAPFKAVFRIRDAAIADMRSAEAPVIFCIIHRSRLDPALMLSLLPDDTLHILDETSAKADWLQPWRGLGRTIAFNAEHIFVSRRLVRVLKGRGRIAVYLPDTIEPDAKAFRLYRAIARIAQNAEAKIVAIDIKDAQHLPMSLATPEDAPRRWFPALRIVGLPAVTIDQLQAEMPPGTSAAANALFDRIAEARAAGAKRTIFQAVRHAARQYGPGRPIIQDAPVGDPLTYRRLLATARVLGGRFASATISGECVGVLLPNAVGAAAALLGLLSAGRVCAMLNYTAGPASIASALTTVAAHTVVSSHAFIEKASLADSVAALEAAGARFLWLEDLRKDIGWFDRLSGLLLWRVPLARQDPKGAAFVLFTSGSEGVPKAIVHSHAGILANARQVAARLTFGPRDTLLNVLPIFHGFGLTGGLVLPLISGVRTVLYPSPLHYKIIPQVARKVGATILFATDTFLAAYAKTAKDGDFSGIRFAVAGAEPLRASTRAAWQERFDVKIFEGYGMTEAAPVVALNTAAHIREGTVGRAVPGERLMLEPVDGIADGGKLAVSGPNLMLGTMSADRPGVLQPAPRWHDTGDIVGVDREGYLTIRGRAKRFAKIAGEMISLAAVDALAHATWPDDSHAAVSVPDKRRGERVVLVTTRKDPKVGELGDAARDKGSSDLMVPAEALGVEEMPLLGTGKIDHSGARKIALKALGLEAAA